MDKIIICQDCRQEFVFTAGEQEFFQAKGLQEPLRCAVCRATFKSAQADKFKGRGKEKLPH